MESTPSATSSATPVLPKDNLENLPKPLVPEEIPTPSVPEKIPSAQPFQPAPAAATSVKPTCVKDDKCCVGSCATGLIYWRDIRKSGTVFCSLVLLLLCFALYSFILVLSYISLAILVVTLSFCIYKKICMAIQKAGDSHPFEAYLKKDISISQATLSKISEHALSHINCGLREVRALFLVEDMVDSLKFGLVLWLMTYVGTYFNALTLVLFGVIGLFTLPKIYEIYKEPIDSYLTVAKSKVSEGISLVSAKIPLLKKKEE